MNILTYDDPTKESNFPVLNELVTLLNEVMPNQLINYPRAIDPTVGEDRSGVIRSEVEEGSADVDQSHFVWTDIGSIIRMLQELVNNGQDSTLGKSSIQHVTYIFYVITLHADLPLIIFPVQSHYMIVITGFVPTIGMHTLTVSEVVSRGGNCIISTESFPHGCIEIFKNIEDATLFSFSKFAHHSIQELAKIQISYALLYTPSVFPNTTMLRASLTDGRTSLSVKLKEKAGSR